LEVFVDADLDTLAIALYARIDDALKDRPELAPWRPKVGIAPKLSDAELLTLAVMQVLLGHANETGWLRYANGHLSHLFPYLPGQAGYNKRLRKSAVALQAMIRLLATDTEVWADDIWLIDSTPVECGRSRPTTQRSNLAGWAGYGYCASHSRYFWGLRLHLVCTPTGLPITYALTNPKVDERDVAIDLFDAEPALLADRHGQTIIADKGYASAEFERRLADNGVELIRPARANEPRRRGTPQLRRLRQIIESVNNTLKAQLRLEDHGGHSPQGVLVRVLQRLLALTAAIWHNHHSQQPVLRSLTAYDH
jgi:Transposase DDE domain